MRANNPRTGARAGALCIAITGTALVSGASPAEAQKPRLPLSLDDGSIVVGQSVQAHGRPGREFAGRTVVLEHRPGPDAAWVAVGSDRVGREGVYRIRHRFERPGRVRAVMRPPQDGAVAASGDAESRERRLAVAPRVAVGGRRLHVKLGRSARVAGRVATRRSGVRVNLLAKRGRGWTRLDRARTRAGGRFVLRDRVNRTGRSRVRLAVARHAGLSRARRGVGRLHGYRTTYASWYGPGFYGQRTGCGSTLRQGQLGVAHKSLPCGTKVTFRHRGRTVRVPVIDRGPYVAGREYDLTEATARRLRFSGHGALLSTR